MNVTQTGEPIKKYWFKNRRFGYGWRPASVEGWLVTLTFILYTFGISFFLVDESSILNTLVFPLLAGLIVLIYICYRTGEPLEWRWPNKTIDK